MINAIIQIPQRLPIGTVISGGELMDMYDSNRIRTKVLSGRSIRVVPLIFYKFFSQWGPSRYEHIFATDEPFDTIGMSQFVAGDTGQYSKNPVGSILFPISMKRIGPNSTETFLFAKSINHLLSNYQIGLPLSDIPFTGLESIDLNKTIEVPYRGTNLISKGVVSYGGCKKHIFEDVLYSSYGSTNIKPEIDLAMEAMTLERPATIASCLCEIISNYPSKEAVWSYIDELYKYETGEHIDPTEFFEEHSYTVDLKHPFTMLDPITAKCIFSPTFILTNNLKHYLADHFTTRCYGSMGYHPENDSFTNNIVPFDIGGDHGTYTKLDMIESLMSIPDDGFSIHMTWDQYVPDYYSYFGNPSNIPTEKIHEACKQVFLNKWVGGDFAYDDIVVSKNWYDEVFISCKNKMGLTTYYINLAWFHLMSPSLINKCLFLNW